MREERGRRIQREGWGQIYETQFGIATAGRPRNMICDHGKVFYVVAGGQRAVGIEKNGRIDLGTWHRAGQEN